MKNQILKKDVLSRHVDFLNDAKTSPEQRHASATAVFNNYSRFVSYLARSHYSWAAAVGLPLDDVQQEGLTGLWALLLKPPAEREQPLNAGTLTSYVSSTVRGLMLIYVKEAAPPVAIPRNAESYYRQCLDQVQGDFEAKAKISHTLELIKCARKPARPLHEVFNPERSNTVHDEEEGVVQGRHYSRLEDVADPSDGPEALADRKLAAVTLHESVEDILGFSRRQIQLLYMRYGPATQGKQEGDTGLTLQEIALRRGMTRESIGRLENEILRKLVDHAVLQTSAGKSLEDACLSFTGQHGFMDKYGSTPI